MNQELWREVRTVFAEAHRLPALKRAEYLAGACEGRPELLHEVTSLLSALDRADDLFPPLHQDYISAAAGIPPEQRVGTTLGNYRIVRLIDVGGMGDVYEAVRDDGTFDRRVAVKLVRSTLSHREMISRFEAERTLLASLQHPNIAQLIDAGSGGDGMPYLIMEYVDGKRIDDYCTEKKLPIAGRLRLFQVVCAAVQFAHQRLIIHRDIKPGNILVNTEGAPKLLDFGIASLLDQAPTQDGKGAAGPGFMTPDYASPEQLRGEKAMIVSDVYALGMLLYKLLTGGKPNEVGADIRKLPAGDVDAIVTTALQKDPALRYQSVRDLSDDIERHLTSRPVTARGGGLQYRAGRFIRRNRTASVAFTLVALAVIGGIGGVLWQANRAEKERDLARIEETKAKRINEFLQGMIAESNVNWYNHGKGPGTTAVDILDAASERIERDLQDEPAVQAELHQTIGSTYLALGRADKAIPHFTALLRLRSEVLGSSLHKLMESEYYLAGAYLRLFPSIPPSRDSAEVHYKRVIDNLSRQEARGDVYLPFAYQDYATTLFQEGRRAEAESCLVLALPLFREHYGEAHATTAFCYGTLGQMARLSGDTLRALDNLRRAWISMNEFGGRSASNTIEILEPLARILIDRGELAEADSLIGRCVAGAGSLPPYERILLARILCSQARIRTLRGETGKASLIIARAEAEIEGAPQNELRRLNGRELIALERGRMLIRRKAYSEARKALLSARAGAVANQDRCDDLVRTCDDLLLRIAPAP